jgi:putative transcription antitermination factor YqgF
VDPGGKKLGLAVGDDQTGIVSPLEVVAVDGTASAAEIVAAAAARVGAARVVIGVPVLADGSAGPAARRTEILAEAVQNLGLQVALQSEYLTTNEARRRARSAGRPSDRPVDDLAAQVILEDYLTGLTTNRPAED